MRSDALEEVEVSMYGVRHLPAYRGQTVENRIISCLPTIRELLRVVAGIETPSAATTTDSAFFRQLRRLQAGFALEIVQVR
jgi:hypothetical protein